MVTEEVPAYITTSWDDGDLLDLRLAELLHKYGLRATFYVPLANRSPVLSPRQVRELSQHFEIGAHTVHHCDLLTLVDDEARREIADCKAPLEQMIGRACTAFCFPKGHFRRVHVTYVREAGYRMSRTVELMSLAMPSVRKGLAMMPTTLQARPAGSSTYLRNSLKRRSPMNFLRYLSCRGTDWVATAETVLEHVVTSGGVFHLWGHSWEIAEMDQWGTVERMFALLAQYKKRVAFADNTTIAEVAQQ